MKSCLDLFFISFINSIFKHNGDALLKKKFFVLWDLWRNVLCGLLVMIVVIKYCIPDDVVCFHYLGSLLW